MNLVLARYYEHYIKFIDEHKLPKSSYRYVRDAFSLRGIQLIHRFFILPGADRREDYHEIMEELRTKHFYSKIAITKI